MEKNVILILIDSRKDSAVKVQKILTEWGCLVKTRLGLHEGVLSNCSDHGLLFLEMVGEKEKHEQIKNLLDNLPGVNAKLVSLEV
ncbi:MAG: hypothetical protein M0R46_02900 [Candidatus Muirbacterium halophilum]|nr:hypothetical protein [Candidatus Muirbacterium halophilum]MCK9474839.1 hypothetical protein [Candidatus Muirbacterium halophilum]